MPDKKLNGKWNACIWFEGFCWKIVMDVHDSVSKNVGYVVDDVDGPGLYILLSCRSKQLTV